MHQRSARSPVLLALAVLVTAAPDGARAQADPLRELGEATELLQAFTADDADAIPARLLQRAQGVAVIPNVLRGGFILGGRRGRGVIVVRDDQGLWTNPAFVTLTGGSIGWQIGAESTDLVLVFANENAVRNLSSGKFTLGGDASAVAGPLGRHATLAVTFKAEVYGYVRSRGLFAGAAFQGARLSIDADMGHSLYAGLDAAPLESQSAATPTAARRFLLALERASIESYAPSPAERSDEAPAEEEAAIFPLED